MLLKPYRLGILGEYLTCILYLFKFHQILARRFKTKCGEIDIICKRFKTIVFVEVKSRQKDYDDIICSIHQQKRIYKAAQCFIARYPIYSNYDFRFDLVLVKPYRLPKVFTNFIVN